MRAMLNSYIKHLADDAFKIEEDVHYCFVEYGGANITHWSFLDHEDHPVEVDRLCARAMLIVDQDGNAKLERKQALEKKLQKRLIVLPCRESENLLPYAVIKEVVLEYEKVPERELPSFEYCQYQHSYLGQFIENEMLSGNFSRKGGYKADSGTLKGKVDFCERALKKLEYATLPPSTQKVIHDIYNFICSQNL
jgi:hypothetical protein